MIYILIISNDTFCYIKQLWKISPTLGFKEISHLVLPTPHPVSAPAVENRELAANVGAGVGVTHRM